MEEVVLTGASGSLAKYVIKAAKDVENIQLSLFVGNKNRLSNDPVQRCKVIQGDAINYSYVKKALAV